MKPCLALTILFTLISLSLPAQKSLSISGVVIDSLNGKVLPYTNISESKGKNGSISNQEGKYTLTFDSANLKDTVFFSFIGYKAESKTFESLLENPIVILKTKSINLEEVKVFSKQIDPRKLIEEVKENFNRNHPLGNQRQRIYLHNYSLTPYNKQNKVKLLRSEFDDLNASTFNDLYSKMPKQFIDYNDAIIDLYSFNGKHKIKPIEAISLQEGSQYDLIASLENTLEGFLDDFYSTFKNEDTYYKFKTGIFGVKIGRGNNEDIPEDGKISDSSSYTVPTASIRYYMLSILEDYSRLDGDNLEFINKPDKYNYQYDGLKYYNDQALHTILFQARSNGLFEGKLYVSENDKGIVQMEFKYAPGKSSENFQILGFGHSMKHKEGKVIYEKVNGKYLIKYILAHEIENSRVDRKFSIVKKKERFLIDKELKEMKFDLDLDLTVDGTYEILIISRDNIDSKTFEGLEENPFMSYKKVRNNEGRFRENRTHIVPSKELESYYRKE